MIGPLALGVKFRDTKSDLRFGDAMLRLMPAGATLKIPYQLPRSQWNIGAQPLNETFIDRQQTLNFTYCGTPRRKFSGPAKRFPSARNDSPI